jgi:hypothetical protein
MDWPLSILGAEVVMAPATRAELTVTRSVAEDLLEGELAPSVTE